MKPSAVFCRLAACSVVASRRVRLSRPGPGSSDVAAHRQRALVSHRGAVRVLDACARVPRPHASAGNILHRDKGNIGLHAFADSSWSTTRSITGYVIFLGGGAIAHASRRGRRQHCITMSSCEAELVALADLAIELLYIVGLADFIGYSHDGPVSVSTDNKGAYDSCHTLLSGAIEAGSRGTCPSHMVPFGRGDPVPLPPALKPSLAHRGRFYNQVRDDISFLLVTCSSSPHEGWKPFFRGGDSRPKVSSLQEHSVCCLGP